MLRESVILFGEGVLIKRITDAFIKRKHGRVLFFFACEWGCPRFLLIQAPSPKRTTDALVKSITLFCPSRVSARLPRHPLHASVSGVTVSLLQTWSLRLRAPPCRWSCTQALHTASGSVRLSADRHCLPKRSPGFPLRPRVRPSGHDARAQAAWGGRPALRMLGSRKGFQVHFQCSFW